MVAVCTSGVDVRVPDGKLWPWEGMDGLAYTGGAAEKTSARCFNSMSRFLALWLH